MSLKQVVWRMLNKEGDSFVDPATTEGQESIRQEIENKEVLTNSQLRASALDVSVDNFPDVYGLPSEQLEALTNLLQEQVDLRECRVSPENTHTELLPNGGVF